MKKTILIAILAVATLCIAACSPSKEELRKRYEENDFSIVDIGEEELDTLDIGGEELAYAFKATKGDDNSATVISFSDGNAASEFYKRQYDHCNDDVHELVKIRNIVIFGSKEAVKLASK